MRGTSGYGKIPPRPPGHWQERQRIAERFRGWGWVEQRVSRLLARQGRSQRLLFISFASFGAFGVLSAAIHLASWLGLLHDSRGSLDHLLLKRLLVDTTAAQLAEACPHVVRIGGGRSGLGGWNVCLDSSLGRRWAAAGKQWDSGSPGSWGDDRRPVQCRGVSVGVGIDPTYDLDLALRHDCSVDVFDMGVDVYRNDFEEARPGSDGRIKFHSRGLGEREGTVSTQHIRRLQLLRSNATEWADSTSLHPAYDIVAQGPGWSFEGHSGSEWRLKQSGTWGPTREVQPLGALLARTEPRHCQHVLAPHSAGCQVDILKIDCGSCEWEAARQLWDTASASVLQAVDQLLMELHLSDWRQRLSPGGDFWKLIAFVEANGFDLFSVEASIRHPPLYPAPWGIGSAPSVVKLSWLRRRSAPLPPIVYQTGDH